MENVPKNGQGEVHGPWFAMCGSATAILPMSKVVEMIQANIQAQATQNLALSALFRKVADAFRDWSRASEPGWVFFAPEVNLHIIRLASGAQQAVVVSEAMEAAAKARQEESSTSRILPA